MIIAALNESPHDTRVAITPASIKHYLKQGHTVLCEKNAGLASGFKDSDYEALGVTLIKDRKKLLKQADILACVSVPKPKELTALKTNALLIAPLDKDPGSDIIKWCLANSINAFSMNLIPRISRAQSMDSLSSQANLAGYRAVLEGVHHYHRAVPMMMTAAGMIHPAKILILGAGVAGLQAIATAKRLGAVVYAFDVRPEVKEQVESLGAEFIEVDQSDKNAEDSKASGGYAREMSKDYQKRQAELIDKYARESDIIVTTALIPGRQAPILITKETVKNLKPGSVVVDLATSRGGNCELSEPDKVIKVGEVTLVGYSNLAGMVPATASELYASNVLHLLELIAAPEALNFKEDDDIIKEAMLCYQGNYLPFQKAKAKEASNA